MIGYFIYILVVFWKTMRSFTFEFLILTIETLKVA